MPLSPLPNPVWEFPIEDGLVLARPDIHGLFFLNQSAALVWHLLNQRPDLNSITSRFAAHCSIPEAVAAQDVAATLESWSSTLLNPSEATGLSNADLATVPPPPSLAHSAATYHLHQKLFRIFTHDAELTAEFAPRLQPLHADGTPDLEIHIFRRNGLVHAICNGKSLAAEPNPNATRAILLPELARLADPNRVWLAILHAGACAFESNCILFPASSYSGKTTLIAALMHSGLQFLSDDSAAVDRQTLEVIGMPFALMIREGSWSVLSTRYPQLQHSPVITRNGEIVRFLSPAPTTVGAPSAARVSTLVFPNFLPNAGTNLERIGLFQSLLLLQESGFWVPHNQESIAAFLNWMKLLPAYQLSYSNLDEAVRAVQDLAC